MKNRNLLSIVLALALLLAGCASTTTIVEESPEASETAAESLAASEEAEHSESPAASADPEASPGADGEPGAGGEPGADGEPGAGGAPGLGMENIVLGRVTDVTEGTVTLALLEPANLPEDAEASAETEGAAESEEAAESAAPEFAFTVDALEETGDTAEYTLEELSAAVEGEAEIAEDAILQLTLDEDGAIASVRVLDAEA